MSQCALSGIDLLNKSTKIGDIGEGTYGLVALYDTPRGKLVIKETKITDKNLGYSSDFITEVDMLLKLRSMEGIVTLEDMCYDIHGKRGYIVMEPLSSNLRMWARTVPIETRISQLETLIRQVGGSLAIMHHFTLIHNDVKPNNILVRIIGDNISFKLSDFGKSIRVAEDSKYGGLSEYFPPEPHQNIYFVEYWAFMIVLLETIIGYQLIRKPLTIQEFYAANVIDNKFNARQFLTNNLTAEQFTAISPIFWKFINPLTCCNCYHTNNTCNINDGFIAAGITFNPRVVQAVKDSISYSVPDTQVFLAVQEEFKKRAIVGKNTNLFENFRRLVNKFFSLDKNKYDNLTAKRYVEVAFVTVMGKYAVFYRYFSDLNTFLIYQRYFLSTVGYQIIIL